jgi:hypothetical protein
LRIAGASSQQIFDPDSVVEIHRYASGIPRVINLLCEHCLVSAFVDQQRVIGCAVVETVARDFELGDGSIAGAMSAPGPGQGRENLDLMETLRSLASLADRLREEEKDLPKERKL